MGPFSLSPAFPASQGAPIPLKPESHLWKPFPLGDPTVPGKRNNSVITENWGMVASTSVIPRLPGNATPVGVGTSRQPPATKDHRKRPRSSPPTLPTGATRDSPPFPDPTGRCLFFPKGNLGKDPSNPGTKVEGQDPFSRPSMPWNAFGKLLLVHRHPRWIRIFREGHTSRAGSLPLTRKAR